MTSTSLNPPARRSGGLLAAILLAVFAINIDTTIVNVALPSLATELEASTSELQWVVDAYNLAFAALLLTFGTLSDRLGRKGVMLAGLTLFGSASAVGGAMTTVDGLIACRAAMGVGAAMAFPSTLSILRNEFRDRQALARAVGLWGAVTGAAIALGPIAGGWLLGRYTWSSVFTVMGPAAAVAVVLAAVAVPTSRDPRPGPLDLPGLLLSSTAVTAFTYTIIEAPGRGWTSAATTLGWAVGAALLIGFGVRELTSKAPLLDVRLFASPRFSAASASLTVAFFTLLGFIFLMTQYLQFVRDYTPLETGVRLLPVAVSFALGSVIGTRLALRAGTRIIVSGGLLMIGVFYTWVALSIDVNLSYGIIAAQMLLFGFGMGATSAPATESILGALPPARAGLGSAVNDTTRLLGGTLGVAVIGSVAASAFTARLGPVISALPQQAGETARSGLGGSLAVASNLRGTSPALAERLRDDALSAFTHAVAVGAWVAVGVAAAGALIAAAALPAQPPTPADAAPPTNPANEATDVDTVTHRS